jgi:hypothetical protein
MRKARRWMPVTLVLLFIYSLNTSTGMVVFSSTIHGVVSDRDRGCDFTLLDTTWSLSFSCSHSPSEARWSMAWASRSCM